MQQVPVHLNNHLLSHLVGELGLEVGDLAVSALLGTLVFLLLVHCTPQLTHTDTRSQPHGLLLDFQSLDIGEPPVFFLILDEITNYFSDFDSPLEPEVVDYFLQHGQSLIEVSAGCRLGYGHFAAVAG